MLDRFRGSNPLGRVGFEWLYCIARIGEGDTKFDKAALIGVIFGCSGGGIRGFGFGVRRIGWSSSSENSYVVAAGAALLSQQVRTTNRQFKKVRLNARRNVMLKTRGNSWKRRGESKSGMRRWGL